MTSVCGGSGGETRAHCGISAIVRGEKTGYSSIVALASRVCSLACGRGLARETIGYVGATLQHSSDDDAAECQSAAMVESSGVRGWVTTGQARSYPGP